MELVSVTQRAKCLPVEHSERQNVPANFCAPSPTWIFQFNFKVFDTVKNFQFQLTVRPAAPDFVFKGEADILSQYKARQRGEHTARKGVAAPEEAVSYCTKTIAEFF
jgi:hypothetical protein